jgi:hypothetical protein
MNLEVRDPIFIVGTGRSGSTVFVDILAKHPNVAWLSRLADAYPGSPWLNVLLMRARNHVVIDTLLDGRFGPSEAYSFWNLNCPGFSNPYRDLLAEDVTPRAASRLQESCSRMVTRRRNRFIAKITGWPRVRYLREIFPQALFIEVTREARATASSVLEVPFWDGWRGPPNWRRGPLPPDLDAIWRQEGESFLALAALEYVIVQRAMAQCRTTVPTCQMLTVAYADFCADPIGVFRKVIEFCHLNWSPRFEKAIKRVRLVNRDDKWQQSLNAAQQSVLQRTLERALLSQDP